jgi:beta-glucosidase
VTTPPDAPIRSGGCWRSTADGVSFRDLNDNGELDPYEDPRRAIEDRVDDLVARMTLEEKAAQLFHQGLVVPDDGAVGDEPDAIAGVSMRHLVELGLTHFNIYWGPGPRALAEWHNRMQAAAEATRLGIPITISSDPRHGLGNNPATSMAGSGFSKWPDPIGLAATRDERLVREFADVVRREYLAVGIRLALHPTADLATEPRWCRAAGTFGEDAEVVARLVTAYIQGMQGRTLGPHSVACMTKHFPGGGPQLDGEDPHFPYGREQVYPGNGFAYHLIPFEAAIGAGTAQIMPYYGMPVGTEHEEVGFGFNRGVITGLLRGRYGFDGVVCSDWGLITDALIDGVRWPARAWGAEHLSREERVVKVIEAGVDQFGGEACPEIVVDLVRSGRVEEGRIDASVRRLLRDKFRLGLFDDPFVDAQVAADEVGRPEFLSRGYDAQTRSFVLLKNDDDVLPLRGAPRVYLEGLEGTDLLLAGTVVDRPEDADVAVVRIRAPYEPRNGNFIESLFHAGDLSFDADQIASLLELMQQVPTVVDIYLDRAAVIPEIADGAAALLADFGATDEALVDIVFGHAAPTGTLPFELPSSMENVRKQLPDIPHDSRDPLFVFGHGLSYFSAESGSAGADPDRG